MIGGNPDDLLTAWEDEDPDLDDYPACDECVFWIVTYAIMATCAFTIIYEYL